MISGNFRTRQIFQIDLFSQGFQFSFDGNKTSSSWRDLHKNLMMRSVFKSLTKDFLRFFFCICFLDKLQKYGSQVLIWLTAHNFPRIRFFPVFFPLETVAILHEKYHNMMCGGRMRDCYSCRQPLLYWTHFLLFRFYGEKREIHILISEERDGKRNFIKTEENEFLSDFSQKEIICALTLVSQSKLPK